jgi:branched-chain amino acid transport system substrate-binding protein
MCFYGIYKPTESVHIALVSPFSGPDHFVGQSMLNAIKLCINQYQHNQEKPIKIVLDIYDDQNNPTHAQSMAQKIVNSKALAVIGHHLSRCSLAASPIYSAYQIPALTPFSTHTKLTSKNPWFFRTIFTDKTQSVYLSQYIQLIYQYKQAILIHDETDYGKDIAMYFTEFFQKNGGKLLIHETVRDEITLNQKIQLKDKILLMDPKIPIVLSSHLNIGLEIIQFLRENKSVHPIFLPDMFYAKRFINSLSHIEATNQSFNCKNIFVISPLFFQTANKAAHDFCTAYKKEYQTQPDWAAAYSYDTVLTLLETIYKLNHEKNNQKIQTIRRAIKNELSSMNHPGKGIPGVTGWIFFDEQGDTNKQLTMGKYTHSAIIPAMRQPMPSHWTDETYQLNFQSKKESQLIFNHQEMIVANMIYTHVSIHKVRNININQSMATLDFEICFHYMNDLIHPEQLLFLNATQPELPLLLIDKKITGNEIMATYEGHGDFYIDRFPGTYLFDLHQVGIQFQHKSLPRSQLIYIHDHFNTQRNNNDLDFTHIINPPGDWKVNNIQSFQDIEMKTTRGNPKYIYSFGGKMGFSRYNHGIVFQKNQFSFRGIFTGQIAWRIFWISTICLLFSICVSKWPRFLWGLMTFSAFCMMISGESLLMYGIAQYITEYQLQWVDIVFDILWWIVPAFMINLFIQRFIFLPVAQKGGLHVANVVPRFLGFIIYLIAGLGIIAFVFDQEISKLLATGGIFAMMIGLAVKMNVADIISGIAINIESPFSLGDWIKIDSFEGVVTDITWRSTRVKTGENAILCIPNSKATESSIQNFNTHGELNWIKINVPVSHQAPPETVDQILMAAVLATRHLVTDPLPKIFFKGTTELNAWFEVFFCIKDYANRKIRIDNVWTSIWKHLRYAEIQLSIMGQTLTFPQLKLFDILDSLDILDGVTREDKLELLPHFKQLSYRAGDIIVDHQKVSLNDFYIIRKGAVRVYFPGEDQELIEVDRMGAGDYFGETGLLGEAYATQIKAVTHVVINAIAGDILFACVDDRELFLDQLRHLRLRRTINRKKQKSQYEDELAEKERHHDSLFFRLFEWTKQLINLKWNQREILS